MHRTPIGAVLLILLGAALLLAGCGQGAGLDTPTPAAPAALSTDTAPAVAALPTDTAPAAAAVPATPTLEEPAMPPTDTPPVPTIPPATPTAGELIVDTPAAVPATPSILTAIPTLSAGGGAVVVGTSLPSTGPRLGPPLTSIVPPTVAPRGSGPPLTPDAAGVVHVTSADDGRPVEMRVGDTLQLALKDGYDWTLEIGDPAVLRHTGGAPGSAQATYQAVQAGRTMLSGGGDPPCRKVRPPCGLMSLSFEIAITVR